MKVIRPNARKMITMYNQFMLLPAVAGKTVRATAVGPKP
jgi:hypothetical protein